MLIVTNYQTFQPNLGPSSVVDQNVHGIVTYMHRRGKGERRGITWVGRYLAVCVYKTNVEIGVKNLGWV